MTKTISPEELLADLRVVAEKKLADNNGIDFTYQRIIGGSNHDSNGTTTGACYYEHRGAPSCIFGHLLANHYDVPLTHLRDGAEGNSASSVLDSFGLTAYVDNHLTKSTVQKIADDVQSLQDNGTPWLEAVITAEGRFERGEYTGHRL